MGFTADGKFAVLSRAERPTLGAVGVVSATSCETFRSWADAVAWSTYRVEPGAPEIVLREAAGYLAVITREYETEPEHRATRLPVADLPACRAGVRALAC